MRYRRAAYVSTTMQIQNCFVRQRANVGPDPLTSDLFLFDSGDQGSSGMQARKDGCQTQEFSALTYNGSGVASRPSFYHHLCQAGVDFRRKAWFPEKLQSLFKMLPR